MGRDTVVRDTQEICRWMVDDQRKILFFIFYKVRMFLVSIIFHVGAWVISRILCLISTLSSRHIGEVIKDEKRGSGLTWCQDLNKNSKGPYKSMKRCIDVISFLLSV